MALFKDRADAGRKLAQVLARYADGGDAVVLALPRGGVPVAYEVARALGAPLDVFLVRKLGLPGHEELAMGAIASGGVRVINKELTPVLAIPERVIDRVARREQKELERRERLYRGDRPPVPVKGKRVILVDDGLATGSSMRAAIISLRAQEPAEIIVAVPVAPPETCQLLDSEVDQVICYATPEPFFGVGLWYADFHQTSDAEVRQLLRSSGRQAGKQPDQEADPA